MNSDSYAYVAKRLIVALVVVAAPALTAVGAWSPRASACAVSAVEDAPGDLLASDLADLLVAPQGYPDYSGRYGTHPCFGGDGGGRGGDSGGGGAPACEGGGRKNNYVTGVYTYARVTIEWACHNGVFQGVTHYSEAGPRAGYSSGSVSKDHWYGCEGTCASSWGKVTSYYKGMPDATAYVAIP